MMDTHSAQGRDDARAHEAMQILGAGAQTLYADVSRGWIRSLAQKGLKQWLYLRDDLLRLSRRSSVRSGHAAAGASAMKWGAPISPTSATEITPQVRFIAVIWRATG